ncbi:RNA-binding motif protein, X-linked 2 [Hypsizygus marmoreus]|uniref:RNA-binding motif protein, X-linked 2 n=1 Tax=Hypsizygus marmoreus TaxID=39966 RepID=A0A369JJT7_HYPMA|nr:RNA-binding motif protein, X-linked 2 [Hypsizygus marmoreus]
MNIVKEINKINQLELDLGVSGASWHDEYKDSAYIFIGGLPFDLTEGDVITIFSQYGEVMDLNMPRDKETGKTRGFGFLMYEDQRSTILAVDNLNGAKVLEKTIRVDHVKNYKQPKTKGEGGEWVEPEEQSLNAKPEMFIEDNAMSDSSASSAPEIDPEDPMRDYLLSKRKEEKALKKTKKTMSKSKHKDETPEERRERKATKKEKKARKLKSEGVKGVEDLLSSLARPGGAHRPRSPPPRTRRRSRTHSRSPVDDSRGARYGRSHSRPRSPGRDYDSRSRRPIGHPDDERDGSPYGHGSRSRRIRDYD